VNVFALHRFYKICLGFLFTVYKISSHVTEDSWIQLCIISVVEETFLLFVLMLLA